MSDRAQRLGEQLDRLEQKLPQPLAKSVHRLRKPGWKWVRIPAGLLLILGSIFSVLPVLGIWMLPLGLVLIAIDIPFLQRPVARLTRWGLDKWSAWRKPDKKQG